jgi:leukotriene-A4 hydrolase
MDLCYNRIDFSSFSNCDEATTTQIYLDLDIDFANEIISGFVMHDIKVLKNGTSCVCFDSSNINLIGDVFVNDEITSFNFSSLDLALGKRLTVTIPANLRKENDTFTIKFNYSVNDQSSAVQWLPSSATKGKMFPYVFTQCQAIHARSLFPCMDTPGVKTPYTARITAPDWCTVLMSALRDEKSVFSATENSSTFFGNISNPTNKKSVFYWYQPVPIPAYLITFAAGNLVSRDISDRVRIWCEPEVIEAAFFEFSETELFIQAAEKLTSCDYKWTRYDVLCLPPSFPFGGMENPCLTFVTPTLLAGDKSLADVIAHEIAHSWTGNLVTNQTWNHSWLNEGWTVWLERKITGYVKKNKEIGKLSYQVLFFILLLFIFFLYLYNICLISTK